MLRVAAFLSLLLLGSAFARPLSSSRRDVLGVSEGADKVQLEAASAAARRLLPERSPPSPPEGPPLPPHILEGEALAAALGLKPGLSPPPSNVTEPLLQQKSLLG